MFEPGALARNRAMIMLTSSTTSRKTHLLSMDHLKEGIQLRGYGQKRSADRIQEGIVHAVPGHDGSHRGRIHPLPVLSAARSRRSGGVPQNVRIPELWRKKTTRRPSPWGVGSGLTNAGPSEADRAAQASCSKSRAEFRARSDAQDPAQEGEEMAAPPPPRGRPMISSAAKVRWPSSRCSPKTRASAVTIPAPAARGKNTRMPRSVGAVRQWPVVSSQ